MIYNFLRDYTGSGVYPFHMPGHKRNRAFLPDNLLDFDITEVPGADNLHSPTGIISDFSRMLSSVCHSRESFLTVNGSSSGVLASILYAAGDIILARNSHKSAYHGLILSGFKPIYIYPDITGDGIPGGVSVEEAEKALRENPSSTAVFITSPTYEGYVSDIEKIAEIAHRYGKLLIVDEAHGAHFSFSDFFPKSANELGADIVIQSLHKTLPVLGQVAVVHVNGSRVDLNRLKQILSFTQTSSPSYILMAQADYAILKLTSEPEWFEKYIISLSEFYHETEKFSNIRLSGLGAKGKNSVFDVDLSKITFLLNKTPLNGTGFENILLKRYNIQVEMSGFYHSVCMTSPADTKEGFKRLLDAMSEIDTELSKGVGVHNERPHTKLSGTTRDSLHKPDALLPPNEAFNSPRKAVPLYESDGRIAGGFVIPYPPGSPLIVPGEKIDRVVIEKIRVLSENGVSIVGSGYRNEMIDVIE